MSRPIEGMTLREKCRDANRVIRELIDHLEQGFLPKVNNLRKVASPRGPTFDPSQIRDVTIRTHAAAILEAEQYTIKLDEEAKQLFNAIATEVEHLVETGTV
jgi:hypothetical protein